MMIDRDSITDEDIQRFNEAFRKLVQAFIDMGIDVFPKINAALKKFDTPEIRAMIDVYERQRLIDNVRAMRERYYRTKGAFDAEWQRRTNNGDLIMRADSLPEWESAQSDEQAMRAAERALIDYILDHEENDA